ncbi:MAG: 3-oxoacyl-[acyl-carrier-protein] reductase [Melioribacteraceae bacterium]|jgi:3-oxoacyl-[acyl-carrier protein] reductase|nr:3-oxoacyl-[acyl-carrier-protein] reductase [Melioribacteraceae bacterium]
MEDKKLRAIVTGGSRGIGKAILIELAKRNCISVMFSDVTVEGDNFDVHAKKIEDEIGNGTKVYGFKADASKFDEAEATVEAAIEKMGGVDIMINNAGITRDNLSMRMTEADFDLVININLKSVFNYTKAAMTPMMKKRFGKIVNIASVVGLMGNAGQSNYSASKAGVIGFTKSMARELSSRNINVNAIAPGFIETDMTAKLNDNQKEALLTNVPLKRMGQPEDIARAVAFLCSSDADYITGQVLTVDGGMVM